MKHGRKNQQKIQKYHHQNSKKKAKKEKKYEMENQKPQLIVIFCDLCGFLLYSPIKNLKNHGKDLVFGYGGKDSLILVFGVDVFPLFRLLYNTNNYSQASRY